MWFDTNFCQFRFSLSNHRFFLINTANWETGTCVNDGKQQEWEKEDNLFRFKEECCGYKFEYKMTSCVGPPTYKPTSRPTKEP